MRHGWAIVALLCAACASPPARDAAAPPFGTTREAAVEVCRPAGERAYLSSLVCLDGRAPTFRRLGSVGWRHALANGVDPRFPDAPSYQDGFAPLEPGQIDTHIVDQYEVVCGEVRRMVFLDMYHCRQPAPAIAVPGFTLAR